MIFGKYKKKVLQHTTAVAFKSTFLSYLNSIYILIFWILYGIILKYKKVCRYIIKCISKWVKAQCYMTWPFWWDWADRARPIRGQQFPGCQNCIVLGLLYLVAVFACWMHNTITWYHSNLVQTSIKPCSNLAQTLLKPRSNLT